MVWYTEARSDGRSRQAVLVEAATPADRRDGRRRTVAPRSELTVDGRRYTVRQVCAYRVVLTPRDAPVPTPAPVPSGENAWPPLAGGRWRLRWHAPQARYTGGNESVVLYDVHDGPKRAHIGVTANKRDGGALYDDARIGDTLEIAGRLWRVAGIGLGKTDVGEGDREFRAGYVDLRPVG
ncbi:hypothetical protein [Streptomyces mobaraensis]|uniref:Uncharacterized protein n=1 Tax=Streptomyces mobaraensis TaxID=35621 RepID=A0A5N5W3D0_STRMB|nr:hypothetical protein [Streptomyces mobaraensis]KAB7837247.1 hypothetical protein FRZ00_23700 [Streptomyces mobaraensis]